MSNSYGGKSWVLDTAGEVLATGNKIKIRKLVYWPNAADNDVLVQDAVGGRIWKARAKVPAGSTNDAIAELTKDFGGAWFDGFDLETIDAGTLVVFFD